MHLSIIHSLFLIIVVVLAADHHHILIVVVDHAVLVFVVILVVVVVVVLADALLEGLASLRRQVRLIRLALRRIQLACGVALGRRLVQSVLHQLLLLLRRLLRELRLLDRLLS